MLIYGINNVKEALKKDQKINKMWIQDNPQKKKWIHKAKIHKIQYEIVQRRTLDTMTRGKHQGIIIEMKIPDYVELDEIMSSTEINTLLICDGLEDPHNLGAILRTCDATDVNGVIIPRHRSVGLNETVAKVSTGAIHTVKVHQAINIVDTIKKLKDNGYWVVALENGIDAHHYTEFPVDVPLVIVVGSEGQGISRLVLEQADFKAEIPMFGSVNSLNVSVATAIILYDIVRRRNH